MEGNTAMRCALCNEEDTFMDARAEASDFGFEQDETALWGSKD